MEHVTIKDIETARGRIHDFIYQTPLDYSRTLSTDETTVYLKLECQQKLKAFKIRGALNKLLSLNEDERKTGVIASSSGNHGCGLSYAGNLTGIDNIHIFVPETAPAAKVDTIRHYGANVRLVGKSYDETHHAVVEEVAKNNYIYVDSSGDPDVIAGQGTIGLEILEQNPAIDTVVVPIGGGGIITGIGIAVKSHNENIRVIGVQTEACPAFADSLRDDTCYLEYPSEESICDSLIGGILEIPFEMADQCIDEIVIVSEKSIRKAVKLLLQKEKVVAEPGGASVVAALMEYSEKFIGHQVALVVTGGNIDSDLLSKILEEE